MAHPTVASTIKLLTALPRGEARADFFDAIMVLLHYEQRRRNTIAHPPGQGTTFIIISDFTTLVGRCRSTILTCDWQSWLQKAWLLGVKECRSWGCDWTLPCVWGLGFFLLVALLVSPAQCFLQGAGPTVCQ